MKSLKGNKCAQVYTDGNFTAIYPMITRAQAGDTLHELSSDVGIPDKLICDLAGEHTGDNTEFIKQVK